MFTLIWHFLPANKVTKLIITLVLSIALFFFLMMVVFPPVEAHFFPAGANTV